MIVNDSRICVSLFLCISDRPDQPNDVRIAGTERDERLLRLLYPAYRLLQAKHTQRALQQREKPRLHGPNAVGGQRRRLAFQRLRRRIRHRSVLGLLLHSQLIPT